MRTHHNEERTFEMANPKLSICSSSSKKSHRSVSRTNTGVCEGCDNVRSLRDGLCHECEQMLREQSVEVDANGEEWTPGGYAL